MPFVAALLAAALHVAMAVGVWWIAPVHRRDLEDDAIEVTMEEPKSPQETPAPPLPPAAPSQSRPAPQPLVSRDPLGVSPEPPEATLPAERPKVTAPVVEPKLEPRQPPAQVVEPKPEPPQPPAQAAEPKPEPSQPPAQAAEPKPAANPAARAAKRPTEPSHPAEHAPEPTAAPQQEAAAALLPQPPTAAPAAEPPLEEAIPPVDSPPAPVSRHDFVKVAPAPPAPPRPPPRQHQAPPPRTAAPSPLQNSPLSSAPSRQPSTRAATPTFVNPADASQTRVKEAYLWQVIRKFSQYLPDLRQKNEGGTVVLRFAIARDGRLVDASIVQSSGVIALDRGLLEALKAASPYPPLPQAIPGSQVVFTQPIAAKR
jgi:TonB family protein